MSVLDRPGPVLVVAHGGSLFALAAMLGVAVDMPLLANAHPLRIERRGPTWGIEALSPATPDRSPMPGDGAAIA